MLPKRLHPLLFLTLVGLVFFGDLVLHPDQVLYSDHSDLLPLHLPSKVFLVRSWQETGELPLWNPYCFSGMPFIHDIQVSAFYPLHWPLFLLPADHLEERMGAALSWLVLLHVLAAGWCMYAYARHLGLERIGATASALGYMFAGKWLLHVLFAGHYNMIPLAWLPLVMLCLERAIQRKSLLYATGAGAGFALFVLGAYPYVTLYAGMFLALWTLGSVKRGAWSVERGVQSADRTTHHAPRTTLLRWLLLGAWTALVGVALGAVQLLPSLEGSKEATRSLGVEPSPEMLREGLETLLTLTGRALVGERMWDYEGGIGFLWLALAVLAPFLGNGRVRFQAVVGALLLLYVLGGSVVMQKLPGFHFFRVPSRMLLLAAFPVSVLAGTAVQLLTDPGLAPEKRRLGRRVFLRVLFAVLILQGGYVLARGLQGHPVHWHPYWFVLPFTVASAFWLLGRESSDSDAETRRHGDTANENDAETRRHGDAAKDAIPVSASPRLRVSASLLWIALLLTDLWTLTGPIAVTRPAADIFTPSPCVRELATLTQENPGRVMDRIAPPAYGTYTPLWSALPVLQRLEAVGGFNPTDVRRYKEYLQFIADSDAPLRPPEGPFTQPVLDNFAVKNKPLLDLLGVRYLLQPRKLVFPGESPLDQDRRWRQAAPDDPAPTTFDFTAGGIRPMPPYRIYENLEVRPRAFVVPEAEPLPERSLVLEKLKATDFRRVVLLERRGDAETRGRGDAEMGTDSFAASPRRRVAVSDYQPNRVVLEAEEGAAGYLVLADIWFPGWNGTVNGRPVEVYRANYLFRAVEVPAESCTVVFTFAPASYALGKTISLWAAAAVLGLFGWRAARGGRRVMGGERPG